MKRTNPNFYAISENSEGGLKSVESEEDDPNGDMQEPFSRQKGLKHFLSPKQQDIIWK